MRGWYLFCTFIFLDFQRPTSIAFAFVLCRQMNMSQGHLTISRKRNLPFLRGLHLCWSELNWNFCCNYSESLQSNFWWRLVRLSESWLLFIFPSCFFPFWNLELSICFVYIFQQMNPRKQPEFFSGSRPKLGFGFGLSPEFLFLLFMNHGRGSGPFIVMSSGEE